MSPLVILIIFGLCCLLVWFAATDGRREKRHRDPGAVPGDGDYRPYSDGGDGGGC